LEDRKRGSDVASSAERKYATTVGTVVAVTEKMIMHYNEKTGCEWVKMELSELKRMAWEYLAKSNRMMMKGMEDKDLARVAQAMDHLSDNGLESVRSYRTYLAFQLALLSEREQELEFHNGNPEKISMVADLKERTSKVWEYYASKNKREDLDADATKLLDTFNKCFA
jgi:hypothetical protein